MLGLQPDCRHTPSNLNSVLCTKNRTFSNSRAGLWRRRHRRRRWVRGPGRQSNGCERLEKTYLACLLRLVRRIRTCAHVCVHVPATAVF